MTRPTCPADNQQSVDQSSFWDGNNLNWDAHRIGWAVAGGCAVLTVLISLVSVLQHARNYTNRAEQRQILRILYMPPVYAIISFLSYRFFRSYTYYSFIEVAYEAVTLSAFLLLLIEYVAATGHGHSAESAIARKDKTSLPLPFCCWRYRPTKAYFMYTVKWTVLQYVIVRPAVSIAGIVCEYYGVLCPSGGYSIYYAEVYLDSIDFVSISIALYGLFMFYGLTHAELQGRRPLAKFLAIKLIVMFTFYQSFVFDALEGRVIKATQYWTEANIADGLTALTICIEMVFFAALMMWAYPWSEYNTGTRTSIWRPLWDSINYSDFAIEIFGSVKFYIDYFRGAPGTHGVRQIDDSGNPKMNFSEAFGIEGSQYQPTSSRSVPRYPPTGKWNSSDTRKSDDEGIRLATYGAAQAQGSTAHLPSEQGYAGGDYEASGFAGIGSRSGNGYVPNTSETSLERSSEMMGWRARDDRFNPA